jgi:hypothetical protein
MKLVKALSLVLLAVPLAACDIPKVNKTVDNGIDKKHLSHLKSGIWVDPRGCDHWIIDDGVEGYLSARLDKYGKPVCSGIAPPNTANGNFKAGSPIGDLI